MKFFFSVILVFISFTTFSKTLSIQGNKKLSLEDIQQLSKIDIYSQDLNESKKKYKKLISINKNKRFLNFNFTNKESVIDKKKQINKYELKLGYK